MGARGKLERNPPPNPSEELYITHKFQRTNPLFFQGNGLKSFRIGAVSESKRTWEIRRKPKSRWGVSPSSPYRSPEVKGRQNLYNPFGMLKWA